MKIKVAIADDHALFRKGLISLMHDFDDLEIVFEAEDGKDLMGKLKQAAPDVILMDLEMPHMDGIEATKKIIKEYPDVKIIILSMHDEEKYIIHLIEAGASGYLLKSAPPEEVEGAIKSVVDKGHFLNDHTSKVMMDHLKFKHQSPKNVKLGVDISKREKDVLQLICHEMTTPEIADHLCISTRTVEWHRQNLLDKTGAKNTAGLVVFAIKHELFDAK